MPLLNWKRSSVTRQTGAAAEDVALAHLQAAGMVLVTRNYRTPGRGGGEIDLVMRAPDGTLLFVEVRARSGAAHGGEVGLLVPTGQCDDVLQIVAQIADAVGKRLHQRIG